MTEKRFVNEDDCCGYYTEIIDNKKEVDLSLHNPKKNLTIEELVDLLNEQNKNIIRKDKQINYLKRVIYNNEPKIFVQAVFNDLEKIE